MTFDEILEIAPYTLTKEEKEKLLTERLVELTRMHRKNCKEYDAICRSILLDETKVSSYKELPFLPVRLFKELSLKSISDDAVVKTMTSSGTTGQKTSKIYLDKVTSANQQKAMVKIVNEFTGSGRMPMIILDCPSVVKNRAMFSARGAGILGFSMFGSKKIYALDDDMKLDVEGIQQFLEQYQGQRILLFGFTFMVWQYFYQELVRLKEEGITFDLSEGVLIHGGGWKKLASEAVSPQEFHDRLQAVCGLDHIHDYYGMVEQTGCIYMQCECGHLHASVFSDVIVRRPADFSECEIGETGIIQVVSTIPESYPGHSLLTEDEGVILGEDDCPCGRKGKYFKILGRLKNAELRGCSDTFAADHTKTDESWTKMQYLVGDSNFIKELPKVPAKEPFAEDVLAFLQDVSKELLQSREAKAFADVVTLGFWLRKASLLQLKERFTAKDRNRQLGRGVAFHIAPSNVPVNYAYSLFTGLLCGNANVVRIPSKDFPQVTIINKAIQKVLDEHEQMKPYVVLVRYGRNKEINDALSALCDVRIIWGGNDTIKALRQSPLPPRATEITFADRYSLAIINADTYLQQTSEEAAAKRVASDFYNDTYLSDQNACTSPRTVVWMGKEIETAKAKFWQQLQKLAKEKYPLQPVQSVDKLSVQYLAAASGPAEMQEVLTVGIGQSVEGTKHRDNRLVRIQVSSLCPAWMDYRGNSGYFYEYDCRDIMELRDFCNNTHCQTIGMFGDAAMVEPLLASGIKGVDRVVPIGHTMDFDLVWDGYNLVERLTRTVSGI
jgi:hypothetical protein